MVTTSKTKTTRTHGHKRRQLRTYTIQSGDTFASIAIKDRDDRRHARAPQPGRRPDHAPRRREDPCPVTSAPAWCTGSDRHRNPQRRGRPDADGPELPVRPPAPGERAASPSAGGKGINVARALKRLETPVVATGLAGGRTGERIVEDLALEGILSDFVRISDESRTSIAVVDPTAGALTEVYEWGPAVRPEELQMLVRQAPLPLARRQLRRLLRLAAARRRERLLRRGDPRPQPARHPVRPRLRGRAAAPRRRGRAVPRLAEPAGGREPRRPGVHGRGGLRDGARHDRRPRRAQRPHHAGDRVLRALPRGAAGAAVPRLDPARRADRARRRRGRSPRRLPLRAVQRPLGGPMPYGRRSGARPHRSSSSAPDASTRKKRSALAAGVEILELAPVEA